MYFSENLSPVYPKVPWLHITLVTTEYTGLGTAIVLKLFGGTIQLLLIVFCVWEGWWSHLSGWVELVAGVPQGVPNRTKLR